MIIFQELIWIINLFTELLRRMGRETHKYINHRTQSKGVDWFIGYFFALLVLFI